jgi:hypothetical protein
VLILAQEGMLAMVRYLTLVAIFISGLALANTGCRSCSSCHDYDRPVADCECGTCGCGRAGSAFTGGCNGGCSTGGCSTGGCSTCESGACGCESQGGGYDDEAAVETELVPQ